MGTNVPVDISCMAIVTKPLLSAQLTVLATATVVSAEDGSRCILLLLTGHAQPNARNRRASAFRYVGTTVRAVDRARTTRQSTLSTEDSVLYRGVDLILNRSLSGPTCSHAFLR